MRRLTPLLALGAALTVAACSNNEAGSFLDGGTFGNATMNNHLVQTCQGVTHAKWSGGKCPPRTWDGKYAKVTYDNYVADAAPIPTVTTTFGDAGTAGEGG